MPPAKPWLHQLQTTATFPPASDVYWHLDYRRRAAARIVTAILNSAVTRFLTGHCASLFERRQQNDTFLTVLCGLRCGDFAVSNSRLVKD